MCLSTVRFDFGEGSDAENVHIVLLSYLKRIHFVIFCSYVCFVLCFFSPHFVRFDLTVGFTILSISICILYN